MFKEKVKHAGYAARLVGAGLFIVVVSAIVMPVTAIVSIILRIKEKR